MNKYESGDIITLDKGEEYLVVDYFPLEGKEYMYAISTDNKNDIVVFRCVEDDVIKVTDKIEYNKVLVEVVKRNKDEINEVMNGSNEN